MTEATTWPKAEIKAILEIPWVGDQHGGQDQLSDDIVAQKLMAIMRVLAENLRMDTAHHVADGNLVGDGTGVGVRSLPSVGQQAQPATVEISRDDILDLLSRGDEDEQADNIMSYLSAFDVRKK